ncbi:MAG: MFS transporter [Pseudonocardiaceae bacterium]
MKRPASPSGAEDPHSGERPGAEHRRRGVGRGRSWVPDSSHVDHPLAAKPHTEPLPTVAVPTPQPIPEPIPSVPLPAAETSWSTVPDPATQRPSDEPLPPPPRYPRKITVTRVAAWRSKQLVSGGARRFHRATTADGAGRSGLSSLTYATMMNYAADAAIAVALANTLFFAAATAESRTNVALYLLITVAPFGVIAPVVGPLLDRLQHGRRVAMAMSFVGRSLLLVVMAMHVQDWLLYPAALGFMVLSKSFGVLKAAVTPRVLPSEITLVKTNSRLTVFGLIAGGLFGAVAAGVAALAGSAGALWFTAVVCLGGAALCLRIPAWVEVTEGEVPASLRTDVLDRAAVDTAIHKAPDKAIDEPAVRRRQPMSRNVVVALWGNATARVLTGFLTLFMAFVVKAQTEGSPGRQVVLLGIVGAAAGLGAFLGNAVGARSHFGKPSQAILGCVAAGLTMAVLTALVTGIAVVAVTALVAATCSAIAKVCLDAVIQRDMPEASRASAFGRSETVLQLAWVTGGALGVLLPPTYWIGFASVSGLLTVGLVQTMLAGRGSSLIPGFGGGTRPVPRTYQVSPSLKTREFTTMRDPAVRPRRSDAS